MKLVLFFILERKYEFKTILYITIPRFFTVVLSRIEKKKL